ncbi:PRC-barrel domain-containing protein [Streptomyces griseosporeus]|uniref:PRC-barrel domain-containing protein n=1 Tax=Streptomyces griseosporeus TaxID=1910 RepID=UPI0036FBE103
MMLFSQVRGLSVFTAVEAEPLGRVEALTIDPRTSAVAVLRLSGGHGRVDAIAWDAVEAVGPDAVIVRSRTAAEAGPADAPVHHEALGSRVLTDGGVEHGTVTDVSFDPSSGRVRTLHTALGDIPGEHLIGLGSYAAVVRTEPGRDPDSGERATGGRGPRP